MARKFSSTEFRTSQENTLVNFPDEEYPTYQEKRVDINTSEKKHP